MRYDGRAISHDAHALQKKRTALATIILPKLAQSGERPQIPIRVCRGPIGSIQKNKISTKDSVQNHALSVSTQLKQWLKLLNEIQLSKEVCKNWNEVFENLCSTFRHLTATMLQYLNEGDTMGGIIAGWTIEHKNSSGNYAAKHDRAGSQIVMRRWSKMCGYFFLGKLPFVVLKMNYFCILPTVNEQD